jgi:hypothetical protein
MKRFIALYFALTCGVCWGQINVQPEYTLYEPIEYSLEQTNSSQAIWEIKPLDGQTKFTSKKYGNVFAFWGQPGRYQLDATIVIVDFDAKTFDIKKETATFAIVSGPTPPPVPPTPPTPTPPTPPEPPSPSVPTDKFNNIGQRVDALADEIGLQYDLRLRVAEVFSSIATQMKDSRVWKVADAKQLLTTKLNALNLTTEWKAVEDLLLKDATSRTPMSFEEVQDWYQAISVGYKG